MQRKLGDTTCEVRLATLQVGTQHLKHAFQESRSRVIALRLYDLREEDAEGRPARFSLGVSGMVDGRLRGEQQLLCRHTVRFETLERKR